MRRNTVVAAVAAVLTAALLGAATGPASAAPPRQFTNPVSKTFADTFADPSLIRGKDGWWYSYGTSDPLREGEGVSHRVPIARSHDLVTWQHVGDAFTDATLPRWATPDAGIWAPDIRFVDGQYRMYYVVTQTTVTAGPNDNAVGMATAPSPVGPWTDSGAPVVAPRPGASGNPDDFLWSFDPTAVTDPQGRQWLFYGSYYGGIYVTRLAADGRTTVGTPTMVAVDNKFEGAYAVRRGGYWYLFASTANCCAGPTTGYSVQVGRSRDLRGPYLDQQGNALNTSRAGGTPVLTQNGNSWVGAGHNAVVTDLAGQDWIAYHAIDRADPYLDGTDGVNERPMLLDRLDWVDGWPTVNAGAGPSDTRVVAPVTAGAATFDHGVPAGWRTTGAGWAGGTDRQSGSHLRSRGAAAVVTQSPLRGATRVEAEVRTAGPSFSLFAGLRGGDRVVATVDPARRSALVRQYRHDRVVGTARASLPVGYVANAWHAVSLQLQGRAARLQVSNARLGDPVVDLALRVSGRVDTGGRAGVRADGAGVRVDDLSALKAATPVTRLVRDVVPQRLDRSASDEFDGSALSAGWSWVRQDPAAALTGSALRWPTQAKDLTGTSNDAALLLRDPGAGSWTVQTRVTIDLGTDTIRNFSQAGLVAYVDDDLFTRLSHVAIWNTRQTEFGKEMPYAGRLSYGGTIVGPPSATTDLRLTHRVDPANGEHELRAWTRQPGRAWVKGGVWTLPAGSRIQVGLVSHGGAGATADFDYFHLYR